MDFDAEDLSYPPSGGRVKLTLLGIALPLGVVAIGVHSWTSQEAWWPGSRGSGVMVHGDAAKAFAVLYMSLSAFVHSRWCWGLLGYNRVFETGTVISILGFLGSMLWAFCAA